MGGDPGHLGRLDRPEGTLPRHPRPPVRVAETKRPKSSKPPAPLPVPSQAAQAALLGRIEKGQSKITIDIKSFTPNPAVADTQTGKERLAMGEAFKKQYLAYMKELAATPVGFKLLSDLDQSKHGTTLTFDLKQLDNHTKSASEGATDKKGTAAEVIMNPNNKTYMDLKGNKDLPWMTEREKYGYYHELVHAWHVTRGTQATGSENGVRNAEWQATGFGPHADPQVNENAIRKAMGKAERPTYNDVTYKP